MEPIDWLDQMEAGEKSKGKGRLESRNHPRSHFLIRGTSTSLGKKLQKEGKTAQKFLRTWRMELEKERKKKASKSLAPARRKEIKEGRHYKIPKENK